MNLVFGHDATVNDWLDRRYGVLPLASAVTIGTIDSSGVLRGAFVTTWKSDATAELHLYGKTSNDTWKGYFHWVFANAYRLEIRTGRKNKSIKRAAPKFGFVFSGVDPHYYGENQDALVFWMTKERCRWIGQDAYARAA